jgi:hypothetical protein
MVRINHRRCKPSYRKDNLLGQQHLLQVAESELRSSQQAKFLIRNENLPFLYDVAFLSVSLDFYHRNQYCFTDACWLS